MTWKSLFDDVVNSHAPLKKFRASKSQIPWYNEKIETLIQIRGHIHRKAIITENRVTTLVIQVKTEYYTNGIKENRGMCRFSKGFYPNIPKIQLPLFS